MNNLMPYEPLNVIGELNSLMENLWGRPFDMDDTKVATSRWLPAVDIKEEPNRFLVYADLPGVDPKGVEISMENNVLTIKGTREKFTKEEKETYSRVERMRGSFYRRFTLPDTADSEHISAKAKQGVLEVIIPKKQRTTAHKIEIKVAE